MHAFSSLNYIISSHGHTRAQTTGGLRYWNNDREMPDVSVMLYGYPKVV